MSQAVHVVGNSVVPGSALSEGKCFPCPGFSGRAVSLNPCSSRFRYGLKVNVGLPRSTSIRAFVCRASSNNGYNRRNPDFPRQNKQGFSRGWNRQQNDERDRDRDRDRESFESLDESDILSSKNGPYMSLSNSPKFQATAAPGPREKEIVELFRKVQAQLRERAASRDEKRSESVQGQGKENETVDSLLKLLRKHSTEQAKRSGSSSREYSYDPQNGQSIRGKIAGSFRSNNTGRDPSQDSISSSSRPVSNFQRKSPVPQTKFQPVYSDEEDAINPVPTRVNLIRKEKKKLAEEFPRPDLGLEFDEEDDELETDEPELAQLLGGDLSSVDEALIDNESDDDDDDDDDDVDVDEGAEDEEEEEPLSEPEDLSAWKLPELRVLAKSRGVKGYSKMKKGELVDLLSGSSV